MWKRSIQILWTSSIAITRHLKATAVFSYFLSFYFCFFLVVLKRRKNWNFTLNTSAVLSNPKTKLRLENNKHFLDQISPDVFLSMMPKCLCS